MDIPNLGYVLHQVWSFILWLHESYSSLRNIHTTVTQLSFFVISEKALCPDERYISLYGLLFCTMLSYLYQSLHSRHWAQMMFTTNTADYLRLTSAFIIIRLGKGVVMSFILISITLQFDHLEPSTSFIICGTIYFVITEFLKSFNKDNLLVDVLKQMELHIFEGLEEYWVPLILKSFTILLTLANISIALMDNTCSLQLSAITIYTNIVVVIKTAYEDYVVPLREQQQIVLQFPLVSSEQLAQRGDMCAVCLDNMYPFGARITPCQHIFHGQCLRRCIIQYQQCPMCKHPIPRLNAHL